MPRFLKTLAAMAIGAMPAAGAFAQSAQAIPGTMTSAQLQDLTQP